MMRRKTYKGSAEEGLDLKLEVDGDAGEASPANVETSKCEGTIHPPADFSPKAISDIGVGVLKEPVDPVDCYTDDCDMTNDSDPSKAGPGLVGAIRFMLDQLDSGHKVKNWERGGGEVDDDERWAEYIREHQDIGLVTLSYIHHSENAYIKYYVKAMMVGTLIAQLIIPIVLAYKTNRAFLKKGIGFCPANAPPITLLQTAAVFLVYVGKISFLVIRKVKDIVDRSQVLNKSRDGGKLQIYVALDRVMNLGYEEVVYLINLWIIFITGDPVEIVFNALAIEFVVYLDDEMKAVYMGIFRPDEKSSVVRAFREENNDWGKRPICGWQFALVRFLRWMNLWSSPFLVMIVYGLFVFALICKPGE